MYISMFLYTNGISLVSKAYLVEYPRLDGPEEDLDDGADRAMVVYRAART